MQRMNREQFHAALAPHSPDQLRRILWTLYWRGNSTVRERIEAQLGPDAPAPHATTVDPVPERVLAEVREFAALARAGSYLAGDRRVKPGERTRWRLRFRQLVVQARSTLRGDGPDSGAAAMEILIDLACEMRDREYFRSDDPVQATGLVVSDEVALLWARLRDRLGLAGFAERAVRQLIRWESPFGWTRSGYGTIAQRERTLAQVMAATLPVPDAWTLITDAYLAALDDLAPLPPPPASIKARRRPEPTLWQPANRDRHRRAENLSDWHLTLIDRLTGSDAEDRLDRLVGHPALAGPEHTFLRAQLAHRRGDLDTARALVADALTLLPGHTGFLDFATQIGAPLPPQARQVIAHRQR